MREISLGRDLVQRMRTSLLGLLHGSAGKENRPNCLALKYIVLWHDVGRVIKIKSTTISKVTD